MSSARPAPLVAASVPLLLTMAEPLPEVIDRPPRPETIDVAAISTCE
jgi:hypothetical protein